MGRPLDSEAILKDLHKLWADLGNAESAAPGASHGVLRACALTVIVASPIAEDSAAVGGILAELMREYPNRTILLRIGKGAELDYRVVAQCWRPAGRNQQICCEQIEIDMDPAQTGEIEPVLRSIVAPDLPAVIWCRTMCVLDWPGVARLGGYRLIVNSAAAKDVRSALPRLAHEAESGLPIADLAWTRITRWREIVAQTFESAPTRDAIPRIMEVRILHSGAQPPASAYYLAGWTAAALGRDVGVRFEPVAAESFDQIGGIELSSPDLSISVLRQGKDAVLIRAGSAVSCAGIPPHNEASLVAEELNIRCPDRVYHEALRHAARIAAA